MTADLLERTAYTARQVLGVAGLEWSNVQRVLLVGGSRACPWSPHVAALTGIQPEHPVNPDEAVARGAAIYAGHLLADRGGRSASFKVTNVNSHSLGVEGIDKTRSARKTWC